MILKSWKGNKKWPQGVDVHNDGMIVMWAGVGGMDSYSRSCTIKDLLTNELDQELAQSSIGEDQYKELISFVKSLDN